MVSRVYPPPVSPRKASSAKPGSGVISPTVDAVTATNEDPRTAAPGAPADETVPSGPLTNISPLGRRRSMSGPVSGSPSIGTPIVPTISSAQLAWPVEQPATERVPQSSETGLTLAAGGIDAESLSIHNELTDLAGAAPASVSATTLTLERPAVEPSYGISPRFDFSSETERVSKLSWSKRMVQGTLLLALVAAVGAFIVILPEDPSTSGENAESTTRIRAVDTPTASAELLSSANRRPVEAALGDAGELGRDDEVIAFAASGLGTPADSGHAFDSAVAAAQETAPEQQSTTTTTAWVEPTIPPESEWVDAGNGFMVPDLLLRIRFCESTNNYQAANSSSTARGAYQFLNGSWDWYGHAARTGVAQAHLATPAQQDESALLTLQSQGTTPWLASRDCWASEDIDPRYATAKPKPTNPTTTTVQDDGSSTTEATGDTSTSTSTDDSTPETTVPASSSTTESSDQTTSSVGDEPTTTGGSSSTTSTTSTTTTNP